MLFKASDHKFSSEKFHYICDNKGETIVFIENELGKRFGGRTTKSWEKEEWKLFTRNY
jgi:hypothetical protein